MPVSSRPPPQHEPGHLLASAPARGSVKGLLVGLVLLMLALLLWQLHQDYRQLQDGARERNYTLTRELASHLELVMQMKAGIQDIVGAYRIRPSGSGIHRNDGIGGRLPVDKF